MKGTLAFGGGCLKFQGHHFPFYKSIRLQTQSGTMCSDIQCKKKLIIIPVLFIGFTHHSLYISSPGPDKSFVLLFKKKTIFGTIADRNIESFVSYPSLPPPFLPLVIFDKEKSVLQKRYAN